MSSQVRDAFDDHYSDLIRFALVLGADAAVAEDHVCNAFVRSWRRIESGRVDDAGKYLRRAVANGVNDEFRRRGRRERLRIRDAPPVPGPGEMSSVGSDIAACVVRLPRDYRLIVVCRFYMDMSVHETAAHLGIPIGTVESRTNRALAALRSMTPSEVQ